MQNVTTTRAAAIDAAAGATDMGVCARIVMIVEWCVVDLNGNVHPIFLWICLCLCLGQMRWATRGWVVVLVVHDRELLDSWEHLECDVYLNRWLRERALRVHPIGLDGYHTTKHGCASGGLQYDPIHA